MPEIHHKPKELKDLILPPKIEFIHVHNKLEIEIIIRFLQT